MAMVLPTSKQSHPCPLPNQQPELRAQECIGDNSTIAMVGALVGQGTALTCGANGRHNEVNFDGSFDRFSGCEATMSARGFQSCVSIFGREPRLNDVRYGLRGVCVGEASNPGPQSRVRPHREDVAEDLLQF